MSGLVPNTEDFVPAQKVAILELTVLNHPGIMSHICGLFSRRAFNVEGILCVPIGTGERSRVRLFVHEDERLDQVVKQVQKLQDVLEINRHEAHPQVFDQLEKLFLYE